MHAIVQNSLISFTSLGLATLWTSYLSHMHARGKLHSSTTRKLIHFSAAPAMIFAWPLYTHHFHARFFAAITPFFFALRLYLFKDALSRAVSRSSITSDKEPRAGPFAYCVTMTLVTTLLWRHCVHAWIAAALMTFGDGFADIVGSRSPQCFAWTWAFKFSILRGRAKRKSIPGAIAFFVFGSVAAVAAVKVAEISVQLRETLQIPYVIAVTLFVMFVELLPVEDNYSVPLAAVLASRTALSVQRLRNKF